jgi:hypothetical protein
MAESCDWISGSVQALRRAAAFGERSLSTRMRQPGLEFSE